MEKKKIDNCRFTFFPVPFSFLCSFPNFFLPFYPLLYPSILCSFHSLSLIFPPFSSFLPSLLLSSLLFFPPFSTYLPSLLTFLCFSFLPSFPPFLPPSLPLLFLPSFHPSHLTLYPFLSFFLPPFSSYLPTFLLSSFFSSLSSTLPPFFLPTYSPTLLYIPSFPSSFEVHTTHKVFYYQVPEAVKCHYKNPPIQQLPQHIKDSLKPLPPYRLPITPPTSKEQEEVTKSIS